MKKIINILISFAMLCSCNTKNKELETSTCITVAVDVTDPRQLYPDAGAISAIYDFNNNENGEARFRMCTVTDRGLNPVVELHLPGIIESEKANTEDDPDFRKKLIVHFLSSVRDTISAFNSKLKTAKTNTYQYSECFKTLTGELQKLVEQKIDKKVLIAFTDLEENSAIFNCYNKENRKLLLAHPENVANLFGKARILPESLKNISVYFVYNPVSREDDILFMAMASIYKSLLEKRGAMVIIKANNQNFAL